MRTEQEIRKQAIEECIEIVKDYEGEGMTKVVHKLESLLPPEPTVDKVSDEILHRIKENISPYDSLMIGQCSYVDRKHLYEMASELLSLRTAKAEPLPIRIVCSKPEQAEPYQWKEGDEFEVKEGCTNLYNNVKGGYQGVIEETDYAHPNYSIYDGTYLFRPQDLRLVKSAEHEKAEPSLVDKIKARCELAISNDFPNGDAEHLAKAILALINEAQNGN